MNPHPTKSKPIKIGRKHTGAPSLRVRGRRTSQALRNRKSQVAAHRLFKGRVAAYYRGELETYPKP